MDIEARRKYQREYAARRKNADPAWHERVKAYQRERIRALRESDPNYRKRNAEYVRHKRATDKEYAERAKFYNRRYTDEVKSTYKEACINMYSNGEACCAWCPQADIDVLCLDHINNDGAQWAKKGLPRCGDALYRWLMKNDYPPGLQVLCANCNMKKERLRYRDVVNARRLTQRTWIANRGKRPRTKLYENAQ